MTGIQRITTRDELVALANTLGMRADWHEPGERAVTALVEGVVFDNAGFWGAEEARNRAGLPQLVMWVTIFHDREPVAEVNLATLLAFATGFARLMPQMRRVPLNIPHDELIAVLDDITTRVRAGDSFEGSITWTLPEDPAAPPTSFDVMASYRIGNLQGQGGMRSVGEWAEIPAHARTAGLREQLADLHTHEVTAGRLPGGHELTAIETVLTILNRIDESGPATEGNYPHGN